MTKRELNLLRGVLDYYEAAIVQIEGEWGMGRGIGHLRAIGDVEVLSLDEARMVLDAIEQENG